MASSWIETDSYDRKAFQSLKADSPSLQALETSGSKLLPHFDGFLLDLFALLFKLNTIFRAPESVLPSASFYGLLLDGLSRDSAIESLRLHTALDETQSALGALLLGDRILRLLKSERTLNRAEMLDYWNLKREEDEVESREAEIESAHELREHTTEANRSDLERLEHRLDRENDAARRRLRQKAAELRDASSRALARQRQQLQAETFRVFEGLGGTASNSAAWGRQLGVGQLGSTSLQIELGKELAENPKLRRLAELVGRMREQALALRRNMFERSNEEVFAVGLGAELSRLLPCELIALRHPELRQDFFRRYLDAAVLQYTLRGTDDRGRGPMVVCLDVSSSMAGDKEVWAKAVTLTLLEIARRQRRPFKAICFASTDTPLRVLEVKRNQRYVTDAKEIFDLAAYFPGGGTDFQLPLDAALACLQDAHYRRGDVVFITDGECRVDPTWLSTFKLAKVKLDFRLLSVLIDVGANSIDAVREFSDRITTVSHLTSEAGAPIFTDL